jgi:NAD(P)-dependent dehydrogenase (short-subunit alcohol dehydrogenase family)
MMLDVTEEAAIREAVEGIAAESGEMGLAGLVNNAGIAVPGPIEMLTSADIWRQMDVNVVGLAALTRACLPMLRCAGGRIVNMSSVSGRIAYPILGAYAASKFAVEAMSDALRIELRPWGIRVILVEPGSVQTPIWEKGQASFEDLQKRVPADLWDLYGEDISRFAEITRKSGEGGRSAESVAEVIERALTARRPRARYVPGLRTRLGLAVARGLPTRLWDWLIWRELQSGGSEIGGRRGA